MRKVLVTGTTGLVGSRIYEYLREYTSWEVLGTSRSSGRYVDVVADLRDRTAVAELSASVHADAVIHTAAIARTDVCDKFRDLCYETNVSATCNLAGAYPGSKFVYFSTYAVYNTPEGRCNEGCATDPANYYIETKLKAEECVKRLQDYVIFRPSVIFGYTDFIRESKNYFMQLLDNIRQEKVMRSPDDQYFNPIHVDVVAELVCRVIDRDLHGIYNIGCNEDISKYAFNRQIMERFGFDERFLEGIASQTLAVKRPNMGTVTSAKIQQDLSFEMPPLSAMIDGLYASSSEKVAGYLNG